MIATTAAQDHKGIPALIHRKIVVISSFGKQADDDLSGGVGYAVSHVMRSLSRTRFRLRLILLPPLAIKAWHFLISHQNCCTHRKILPVAFVSSYRACSLLHGCYKNFQQIDSV